MNISNQTELELNLYLKQTYFNFKINYNVIIFLLLINLN